MARTPRKFQESPSACYHVMNRGHKREAVFSDHHQPMQRPGNHRRILVALLLVAVIAACYLFGAVGNPVISQANYAKIQIGWSESQVEELLGTRCSGTPPDCGTV